MRRLVAVIAAITATGLAGAFGAPDRPGPASPLATPSVDTLVQQLGSERFPDREAAAVALERIGQPATKALQAAIRSENPEVRERAAKLLLKIKRTTDSSSRLVARRVKLNYKQIPLGTAINDLKARTGLNLALDTNRIGNPLRLITCETAEVPVWEALEAFCVAANLCEVFQSELDLPKPTGPRRGYIPPVQPPGADAVPIVLIDGTPQKLAGDRGTSVRVVALPASFPGHKVTLGTGEVNFCFDVAPAPGLHWQDFVDIKITRLIDSAGRAGGAGTDRTTTPSADLNGMVVFARPGVVAMRFDFNGNPIPPENAANPRVVSVPLKLATASARSLKRLEGSVYGEVQVPNQQLVTVKDLKQNLGVPFSGPAELKFTVLELKEPARPGELGSLRVQLEYPSPWMAKARRRGWNPGWPDAPRSPGQGYTIQTYDAAGKPFPATNTGFSEMNDNGSVTIQTIQFNFRKEAGVPDRVAVVGPRTVLVEVPFVMENVPLP